jgi:hypothetical protein
MEVEVSYSDGETVTDLKRSHVLVLRLVVACGIFRWYALQGIYPSITCPR